MTRDDIIRTAREAGSIDSDEVIETVWAAFTAVEREECAKVCEEGGRDESGRIHVQAWGCAKAIRARGEQ